MSRFRRLAPALAGLLVLGGGAYWLAVSIQRVREAAARTVDT